MPDVSEMAGLIDKEPANVQKGDATQPILHPMTSARCMDGLAYQEKLRDEW
jgi:hypothetical protein